MKRYLFTRVYCFTFNNKKLDISVCIDFVIKLTGCVSSKFYLLVSDKPFKNCSVIERYDDVHGFTQLNGQHISTNAQQKALIGERKYIRIDLVKERNLI